MKFFGDALRNSITRMSNDPVEIVSFFRSVEQLYKSLDVPQPLQAALVRPHLNERARNLVTKLSPEVAELLTMKKCMMPFWLSINSPQIHVWIGLML